MKILAIETAFETCAVALTVDGKVSERGTTEPRGHGSNLLPFADELLADAGIAYADLDGIVVDRGPGSFTSLRIGLGVAQGLALAHDLPVFPVSSLAMIAAVGRAPNGPSRVLAAMDARMGEVYAAVFEFEQGQPVLQGKELLCAPAELPDPGARAQGVGTAFEVYRGQLPATIVTALAGIRPDPQPSAAALLELAADADPVEASTLAPVYLRDRVTG